MSSVFQEFRAGLSAFEAPLDARLAFYRRTYLHLTGAALGFVGISSVFQAAGVGATVLGWLATYGNLVWIGIVLAFGALGMFAQSMARSHRAPGVQYAALFAYVAGWAFLFSPLIFIAAQPAYGQTLPIAAGLTVAAFGGLSAFVVTTRKDFSFLGPFLGIAFLVALGVIVCGMIFGFNLGIWFSGAMILLAVGSILHSTSNVVHNYRTDEHVAASLELFAGVAMLFWYVLTLLMQLNRRN
jgi:FtsH-binding integral membrane protein